MGEEYIRIANGGKMGWQRRIYIFEFELNHVPAG